MHTGLRDRVLLATLAYTFARIGSVVNLKVEDLSFRETVLVEFACGPGVWSQADKVEASRR